MLQLRFLTTDPALLEAARKYWAYNPETKTFIHPAAELAEFFQTSNQRIAGKLAEICVAYEDTWICDRCHQPNFTFNNRSEYLDAVRNREKFPADGYVYNCPDCEQELKQIDHINLQAQQDAERKLRIAILDGFKDKARVVSIEDIALLDAIFLVAYGRAGLSENQQVLMSLDYVGEQKIRLAPSVDIEIDFAKRLYHNGTLQIHSQNTVDIFSNVTSQAEWSFSVTKTNWFFPVSSKKLDQASSLFSELEQVFLRSEWPQEWKQAAYPTWKQMALWECLEYLDFTLGEHRLEINPGEKTLAMFTHLLEHYSVSQIYSFIWRASKDAAAFYVRERTTKQHAANTVVGTIQRMAEKAEAEGWEVKGYRRDFRLPQSLMSEVLYNAVLKIGNAGFDNKPIEL